MLRVSDNPPSSTDAAEKSTSSPLSIDKKKRQVTLSEPPQASQSSQSSSQNVNQDRALMVSAPKMFAFDALHTNEDSQVTLKFITFGQQFVVSHTRQFTSLYLVQLKHEKLSMLMNPVDPLAGLKVFR